MEFQEICENIKNRKFAPVYILMGEESFFIDRITDLLLEQVVPEAARDFDQIVLYGSDIHAIQIIETARRFPMTSEYQLVVVREAQQVRDIEMLAHYVKNPMRSTVLAINYKYGTLDKRKSLAVIANKMGVLFESKKIQDYKIPAFIGSFLKERSTDIDPKAAQMLADFLGNDISRISKELDKLALLLSGNKHKKITPELVEQNIGISKEYNNFELLKAVTVKDVLKANRIAQYFEKNPKSNPLQKILSVFFNYFSNLLICQYSKDTSQTGIMNTLGLYSAFQTKDYLNGLKYFSPLKVFNLIGDIRTADARSKGIDNASASDSELLKELLYKMLH
ncbi:MAG: DNA polymerase III subunit delta [Tannerellaceae bacterium]|jgi:DNA polymerase-3 subunit delta|nr:DNA polymerase III subunit delta [Tannerellaceae bacterium]